VTSIPTEEEVRALVAAILSEVAAGEPSPVEPDTPAPVRPVEVAGRAEIAVGSTELLAGDQVLAILEPGSEDDLKSVLLTS